MKTKSEVDTGRPTTILWGGDMIRKALSLIVVGLGLFAFMPAVFTQNVTGEVTDANNTVVFKGAKVSITELQRSTTTNDRGMFRFANVPAGNYTLVVSYVGAPDKSVPISVTADGLALGSIAIGSGEGAWKRLLSTDSPQRLPAR
ncbi:MAG: carboxypeptidase-like regulatory domain-containing protein [Proteobacteria bacterium]|nr:carboxypeptidase-like regulatory domain-containing protein [Pseudomonadota bacterium]